MTIILIGPDYDKHKKKVANWRPACHCTLYCFPNGIPYYSKKILAQGRARPDHCIIPAGPSPGYKTSRGYRYVLTSIWNFALHGKD